MSVSIMEVRRPAADYHRLDRNSLLLLLLLTVPAAVMALMLLRWPNQTWSAGAPSAAINGLGSFAMILLSVFFLARYGRQAGILYFSAGLMAMGVIELLHAASAPSATMYLWQRSLSGITGGAFFLAYVLVRTGRCHVLAPQGMMPRPMWWLGGAILWGMAVGLYLNLFGGQLPPLLSGGKLTPMGWVTYALPMSLFLSASAILFFQYYRTRSQELFLVTAISLLLFQLGEVVHVATVWGAAWWFWQLLRAAIYLAVLGYVLREYVQASESLARESGERRKVAEALATANADWENSFNSLQDVMLIVDRAYRIENINNSGVALLGKHKAELLGKPYYDVLGVKTPDEYFPIRQVLTTGRVASIELYDETFGRHLAITCSPVFDGQGAVTKFVVLMRNISERVKAEVTEKALQKELYFTSRMASIGEIAAGIAHEMNNPLTSIIGFAELLARRDIPEDVREHVRIIHESAGRAAGVMKKLLTFARHSKLEKECADLNAIVKGVLEMRAHEMRLSNIECVTSLDAQLPQTMANVGQMEQVLLNIIINAEQAMTKANGGGKLLVSTMVKDGNIRVQITDNGPGISAENLDRIFQPFFSTKGNEGGTGLGLSISYGIINEHGGRIFARSKPGKGASFIFDLPIVMARSKNSGETRGEQEPVAPATTATASVRIMVVDDELDIREVLRRILAGKGYAVDAVSSARNALEMFAAQKYDLVLLDIKMPDMDGIELYDKLKEMAPDLQRRVVCISGEIVSSRNKTFLAENKLPYLAKPFGVQDLLKKVASVLNR